MFGGKPPLSSMRGEKQNKLRIHKINYTVNKAGNKLNKLKYNI
jgi:hypothetical protein